MELNMVGCAVFFMHRADPSSPSRASNSHMKNISIESSACTHQLAGLQAAPRLAALYPCRLLGKRSLFRLNDCLFDGPSPLSQQNHTLRLRLCGGRNRSVNYLAWLITCAGRAGLSGQGCVAMLKEGNVEEVHEHSLSSCCCCFYALQPPRLAIKNVLL